MRQRKTERIPGEHVGDAIDAAATPEGHAHRDPQQRYQHQRRSQDPEPTRLHVARPPLDQQEQSRRRRHGTQREEVIERREVDGMKTAHADAERQ